MKKKLIMTFIIGAMLVAGCSNNGATTKTNEQISNNNQATVQNTTVDTSVTSADEALKMLEDGNQRFLNDKSELRNVNSERRDELKEGQSPYAVIVSCSDSRVTPTTVFNAGLGEIFDIRIAGNVVDDDALGSIEYGAEHLHSPLIVVMGHQSCGAVTATYNKVVKGEQVEGHIEDLVEKIEPSVNPSKTIDDAIHNNVAAVVKEISEDEIIKNLIDQGKVKVIGAYYDLNGKVTFNK